MKDVGVRGRGGDEEEFWRSKLVNFVNFPSIRVPRCIIPSGCDNQEIWLVCFADAANNAGGAAVYA